MLPKARSAVCQEGAKAAQDPRLRAPWRWKNRMDVQGLVASKDSAAEHVGVCARDERGVHHLMAEGPLKLRWHKSGEGSYSPSSCAHAASNPLGAAVEGNNGWARHVAQTPPGNKPKTSARLGNGWSTKVP